MLFNSLQFLIFFPLVVGLYFALPQKSRWVMLLGASYYFYACWKVEYAFLMLFTTVIDYYAGRIIGSAKTIWKRKMWLLCSVVTNLGMLFLFKYLDFFIGSLNDLLVPLNLMQEQPLFHLLLPVGISFYTFQSMSYTIDVYRGETPPEKNLARFALYVSFFPQLVAGPIERSSHLLPQFRERNEIDYRRIADGVKLMMWGFFKKLVIADRLAPFVNQIYASPNEASGAQLAMATYCFAIQIYCDFSAYSDIAIGAARIMGYDLMTNFKRPYLARSIREFWQRWHISLSTWFRDYLYKPLGGSRGSQWRTVFNTMTVFVLSGLWHGANWTFVIWGALHGLFLVTSRATLSARTAIAEALKLGENSPIRNAIQVLLVFHLVVLTWIFFRAKDLSDAFAILKRIATWAPALPSQIEPSAAYLIGLPAVLVLIIADYFHEQKSFRLRMHNWHPAVRWPAYATLIMAIILFGAYSGQDFIYFQF